VLDNINVTNKKYKMHKTKQISTRKILINNKNYIGFKYDDVYNSKQLFKIINESITIGGLIYFNKNIIPKAILSFI